MARPAAVSPQSLFHTKLGYEELIATGAIVGSGGMVVMDEDSCMVDVARYFLNFTQSESCVASVPSAASARAACLKSSPVLPRARARWKTLDHLEYLCQKIKDTSLCALGGTAPNPSADHPALLPR